jgi:hypothetical protein
MTLASARDDACIAHRLRFRLSSSTGGMARSPARLGQPRRERLEDKMAWMHTILLCKI